MLISRRCQGTLKNQGYVSCSKLDAEHTQLLAYVDGATNELHIQYRVSDKKRHATYVYSSLRNVGAPTQGREVINDKVGINFSMQEGNTQIIS